MPSEKTRDLLEWAARGVLTYVICGALVVIAFQVLTVVLEPKPAPPVVVTTTTTSTTTPYVPRTMPYTPSGNGELPCDGGDVGGYSDC